METKTADVKLWLVVCSCLIAGLQAGEVLGVKRAPQMQPIDTTALNNAANVMSQVSGAVNTLATVSDAASDTLKSIGSLLANIGPVFAAVSAIISIVSIFLPKQDSAEVTLIKQKFEELNSRLDLINVKLDDQTELIKYTGVLVSYGVYERKIRGLIDEMRYFVEAPEANKQANKEEFLRQYTATYEKSALHIYESIVTPELLSLGYDVLTRKRDFEKCKCGAIAKFCSSLGKLFSEALQVKATYFALRNMTWRIDQEKAEWNTRMSEVGEKCQSTITYCRYTGYKSHATTKLAAVFAAQYSASYQSLANQGYDALAAMFPTKNFGVIVHKDVYGSEEHHYYWCGTAWESHVWHQHGVAISAIAYDIEHEWGSWGKYNSFFRVHNDMLACRLPATDRAMQLAKKWKEYHLAHNEGCGYCYAVHTNLSPAHKSRRMITDRRYVNICCGPYQSCWWLVCSDHCTSHPEWYHWMHMLD